MSHVNPILPRKREREKERTIISLIKLDITSFFFQRLKKDKFFNKYI